VYIYYIFDDAGNKIREFGDHYHDKGREKFQGFVDGFEMVQNHPISLEIVHKIIPDC